MKKYIQKEELEQGVNELLLKCLDNDSLSQQYSMGYIGAITNVIGLIERLTKMAAKVKRGEWVEVDNAYGTEWLCDNCKMGVRQYQDQPYCSECGAKMNTQ